MLWTKDSRALGSAFSHCLHDNTSAAATPETTGRSLLMRDARKGPRRPPGKKNATKRTTCTSGTGHCMLCHPPATLESLAWPMRPPRWQPFRFARRRPARDLGPSHNWERISATKRFHGLHDTESFSVLRRTQAYRIYVARHAMPHSAHAQSRRIEVLQHVACREQKANSGKRNPEGAGFAVQGPPEWSPGAGRPVEQDTDGPGAGRLFVEDSRDISHASLLRACGVRTGDKPVSRAEYPGA